MFTLTRNPVWIAAFALAGAMVSTLSVRADYVSQTVSLNQSNTMADGVVYGAVLIEAYDGVGISGGGLNAGEVRLTYSADIVADYASVSKTFGIDHVGFNTDLGFDADKITPPAGWKISNKKSLSEFGKFTWNGDGNAKGGKRLNPATLLITGLGSDATPNHFLIGSDGGGDGSVFFAMHVAGFTALGNPDIGSHWVGGSDLGSDLPPPPEGSGEVRQTPEPTGLLLGILGGGFAGFAGFVRLRKQRQ